MSSLSHDEITQLRTALELCLFTPIDSITDHDDDAALSMHFSSPPPHSESRTLFERLFPGTWSCPTQYDCNDPIAHLDDVISLLYLSRLEATNVRYLIQTLPRYHRYTNLIDSTDPRPSPQTINNLDALRETIFAHIAEHQLTLRVVAQRANITQAALSRFKAGGDIRCSSLLNICRAIGISVKMEKAL